MHSLTPETISLSLAGSSKSSSNSSMKTNILLRRDSVSVFFKHDRKKSVATWKSLGLGITARSSSSRTALNNATRKRTAESEDVSINLFTSCRSNELANVDAETKYGISPADLEIGAMYLEKASVFPSPHSPRSTLRVGFRDDLED